MLRREIYSSINELVSALKESKLGELLRSLFRQNQKKKTSLDELLAGFETWRFRYASMSPSAKEIAEMLGLSELSSNLWWSKIIETALLKEVTGAEVHSMTWSVYRAIENAETFLPRVAQIFNDTKDTQEEKDAGASGRRLTILLPEEGRVISSPNRLIDVLAGASELYAAVSTLRGRPHDDFGVLACDSGSNKLFDFVGLPETIFEVNKIFVTIYEKAIFFREKKFEAKVKAIAESLPIIAEISSMEEAKAISPEQAELLKRGIIGGASKVLGAGAVTPQMLPMNYEPQKVLEPKPTLLLEGPHGDGKIDQEAKESREALDPEDSSFANKGDQVRADSSSEVLQGEEESDIESLVDGLNSEQRRRLLERLLSTRRNGDSSTM